MTDSIPEIEIKLEGTVTDGVFRIDLGVEDTLLLTAQFNTEGAELMDAATGVLQAKWAEIHENIIEAYEAAKAEEEANGA